MLSKVFIFAANGSDCFDLPDTILGTRKSCFITVWP